MRYITAKPPGGKDYITAYGVRDAWDEGEEFLIVDTTDYITKDTVPVDAQVRIRYDKSSSTVRVA